ncbi:MAG: hypothetical protein ABSE41_02330 [Bacteroidota bacterium]|jgi:hypothetical protein
MILIEIPQTLSASEEEEYNRRANAIRLRSSVMPLEYAKYRMTPIRYHDQKAICRSLEHLHTTATV